MAHWTERHTKKDIVASYEKELATLRAENERLRGSLTWVSKWKIDETTAIGDLDLHRRVAKEALK